MDEKIEIPRELEPGQVKVAKELLILPDIILKLRTTLFSQEERYLIVNSEKEQYEIKVSQNVFMDEKYKNKEARENEIKRRLSEDKSFIELCKSEGVARKNVADTKNDIEYCLHRLRSILALAKFYTIEE